MNMSGAKCALCNTDVLNSEFIECSDCDRPIHKDCLSPLTVLPFQCSACLLKVTAFKTSSVSHTAEPILHTHSTQQSINKNAPQQNSKRSASNLSPPLEPSIKYSRTSDSSVKPAQKVIMGVDDAPTWFTKFISDQDTRFKELNDHISEVRQLISTSNDTALSLLSATNTKVDSFLANHLLEDTCEIKISPIPPDLYVNGQDKNSIAISILKALDLAHLNQQVASVRYWEDKNKALSANAFYQAGTSNTVVVQFFSHISRNLVLSKTSLLKDLNCQTIFGSGGSTKIYVSAIYPGPVYKLLRIAQKASSFIKFARPVVCNMVVCMRQGRNFPLIPILNESDINGIVSKHNSENATTVSQPSSA